MNVFTSIKRTEKRTVFILFMINIRPFQFEMSAIDLLELAEQLER